MNDIGIVHLTRWKGKKMPTYVFVIGRAGSGKTTLIKMLQKELSNRQINTLYIPDYKFISSVFKMSEFEGAKYIKCADGGYLIKDSEIYDLAIKHICNEAKNVKSEVELIFLEFARKNYCQALKTIEKCGCHPDKIIYVDTKYEKCKMRNELRKKEIGGHFVSNIEMEVTYKTDDIEMIMRKYEKMIEVYSNDDNEIITRNVDELINVILQLLGR